MAACPAARSTSRYSAVVRFEKILDLIAACDSSVHDVSRVELDVHSGLPRFNMPLELGADLALRMRGPAWHKRRRILVLDAVPDRYDRTLSDISGMDVEAHGNQPTRMIRTVRDWLNNGRDQAKPLPGSAAIIADYAAFRAVADDLINELRLDMLDELSHADFIYVVETVLPIIEAARTGTSHP